MGDFNAKVGSDNQGYENVIGVHGLGVMNDNGERFVNACATNNIVIGGSVFPHKRIHRGNSTKNYHSRKKLKTFFSLLQCFKCLQIMFPCLKIIQGLLQISACDWQPSLF